MQHDEINQGRCGECGDTYSTPRPRLNDEGGDYGTGIIAQTYTEGSVSRSLHSEPELCRNLWIHIFQQWQAVRTVVNITANHLGYFEFRLCPKQSAEELVTQECLDRYPLEVIDYPGQGNDVSVEGTHFTIGSATGFYFPMVFIYLWF